MALLRLMINKNADGLLTLICVGFLGVSYAVTVGGGRRGRVKLAPRLKLVRIARNFRNLEFGMYIHTDI